MITLTGSTSITNLSKTIQAPQDSIDNVEQLSVQLPFQALLNNIYSTIDKLPYLKPSLSMFSLNGTNIVLKSFAGLWASKNALTLDYTTLQRAADVTLTGTSVFGGGGFVANTTYYVYAKYDPAKIDSTDIVLRTNAPDGTKTWLVLAGDPQYDHRYIGSVIVIAGPTILAFNMKDGEYRLLDTGTVTGTPLTGIADVNITCDLLPATASQITFLMGFTNTSGGSATFSLKPTGAVAYKYSLTVAITAYSSIHEINLPLIGTPYNGFTGVWSGGLCSAFFQYSGYKE
jgi:hypothetical protein